MNMFVIFYKILDFLFVSKPREIFLSKDNRISAAAIQHSCFDHVTRSPQEKLEAGYKM